MSEKAVKKAAKRRAKKTKIETDPKDLEIAKLNGRINHLEDTITEMEKHDLVLKNERQRNRATDYERIDKLREAVVVKNKLIEKLIELAYSNLSAIKYENEVD